MTLEIRREDALRATDLPIRFRASWALSLADHHRGQLRASPKGGGSACRAGFTVLFTKTSALLRDLAGGRADGSWEPRLRKYLQPHVLILDDFGMREFTPAQAEDLYELICARTRTGSIITTSNRRRPTGCPRTPPAHHRLATPPRPTGRDPTDRAPVTPAWAIP
jgi:hypothetical protein